MNAESSIPRVVALNEEEILANEAFLAELGEIAVAEQQSRSQALEYAAKCLEELAVRPEERYLDRVVKLARFMITRSYEPELDVNVRQLKRLKQLAQQHPMVFLWSHKSHLDSFAFLKAIYDNNFRPQPLSFAGINMAFTGFGNLAKRSGAVFLRRSFKNDPIYKLVFRHYIDYLVSKRIPLSWSIEGTRSRTGKLMPPRLGLIQWVIESYHRTSCEDALLVPVSISFDQIAEMDDYVAMQRGLPKRKESLGWFLGYISGMKAKNGKIYLRFGEPVPVSDAADASVVQVNGSPGRTQVQKLAFEVSSRIEHATPITITDLVTMVLLAANDRALTEQQIRVHAQDIIALIHKRSLPTTGDLSLDSGDGLTAWLNALSATKLLECYGETQQAVYRISPGKQLAAAYYRNTIIHYFLSSAIAEMSIAGFPAERATEDDFWNRVFGYRDLLKFEFFFKTKEEFRSDIEHFLDDRYCRWREVLTEGRLAADALFGENSPLFGHSIMRSFIEAYQVLSRVLVNKGGYEFADGGEKDLLNDCLKFGQAMLLRKQIASESALSEPLFATAVKLARYRGLLTGSATDLTNKRDAFVAETDSAAHAINRLQSYYDQQQEQICDS